MNSIETDSPDSLVGKVFTHTYQVRRPPWLRALWKPWVSYYTVTRQVQYVKNVTTPTITPPEEPK